MASYAVHRLIQNMSKKEGLIARLAESPADVFDEYGIIGDERVALLEASPPALASIGVHPILQMHYLMYRNPDMAAHVTVRDYAEAQAGGH